MQRAMPLAAPVINAHTRSGVAAVPASRPARAQARPLVVAAAGGATAGPQGAKKQAWAAPSGILKINPELLKTGGLDVSGSGLMKQSGLGVGGYAVKDAEQVRTSSTLAATTEVLAQHPQVAAAVGVMLSRVRGLLRCPLPADGAAAFSRPTQAGQFSFELPQVARYQPGQHFLTHEDAFPPPVVANKGYQRRATLLVYLNDCVEGGATKFDILDIAVQPRKGTALLFFPSFINGVPDRRTLHTAQDAVSEKWVTQLWLSCGLRTTAQQPGGMPAFVRGVKGATGLPTPKGRKHGVP